MGHTAVFDPTVRCIYVFGGSKNLKWFNDVHVLDIDEWTWQLVKVVIVFYSVSNFSTKRTSGSVSYKSVQIYMYLSFLVQGRVGCVWPSDKNKKMKKFQIF